MEKCSINIHVNITDVPVEMLQDLVKRIESKPVVALGVDKELTLGENPVYKDIVTKILRRITDHFATHKTLSQKEFRAIDNEGLKELFPKKE